LQRFNVFVLLSLLHSIVHLATSPNNETHINCYCCGNLWLKKKLNVVEVHADKPT